MFKKLKERLKKNKKKSKNNDKNNNKVKSIIFKLLHIIGYISTGIMILSLAMSGCQNKNNQDSSFYQVIHYQQNNDSIEKPLNKEIIYDNYTYYSIYEIEPVFIDFYNALVTQFGSGSYYNTTSHPIHIVYASLNDVITSGANNNYYIQCSTWTTNNHINYAIDVGQYSSRSNPYGWFNYQYLTNSGYDNNRYALTSYYKVASYTTGVITQFGIPNYYSSLVTSLNTIVNSNEGISQEQYEEDVETAYNNGLEIGLQEGYENAVNDLNNPNITNVIRFNQLFDWRVLLTGVGGFDKNTGLYFRQDDNNIIYLKGLTFSSNGKTYNTIRLMELTIPIDNSYYVRVISDSEMRIGVDTDTLYSNITNQSNYARGLASVSYAYYNDTTEQYDYFDIVWNGVTIETPLYTPNYLINGDLGTNRGRDFTEVSWTNDNYKTITIINDDNTFANSTYFGNVTLRSLLSSNASVIGAGNTNYLDIFTLIGGGFASISTLLGFYILPNITIGALFFVPLFIAIMLAIIKVIKK